MTTDSKEKGIGDQIIDWGRSMMGFVEDLIGSETLQMGMEWWKSEEGKKVIDAWNAEAERLADKRNNLQKEWVKETRGYDTSLTGDEADRNAYFYKPARIVENGDGTFGVDTNDDGTAERQFNSRDAAQSYVDEIGGISTFESYGGEGLYSREVEDVVIANQNQIRKVVQKLQSPEDRKKLLDAIAKFADLQADRTSSFITSAMIDEDIVDDDGKVIESLEKARTELINNLNELLGDAAEAINLADAIGTGEINKADFRRAVDVGDALKDQAGDVSDQEYYRAMAVVAANEDKYDLLLASSREAQLDVYNKLQAERYQGGFQGLSTRQTRDIAREFLANNTSLAKQLSDINIENAKILGDAHIRRAKLMGEADVKSAQLEGDASVRGAERTRQSEMKQADRTGQAAISGATNEIKNQDYITALRDKLKFDGYRQELYEIDRVGKRDKALSSGVLEEQKMLQPYRMGPADYGSPDVAQQLYSPEFDWVSSLLDKIGKGEGDTGGLIGTLISTLKDGFAGIGGKIAGMFGGDDEDGDTGDQTVYKSNGDGTFTGDNGTTFNPTLGGGGNLGNENQQSSQTNDGSGVVLNPVLPPGSILDDDGNGVDDRTDMNGDGVINEQDTLYYEPESGRYFNINPINGGREYLDGSETGFFDNEGVDLTTSVPGTEGLDMDGDGVIDTFSVEGINEPGFFQSDEDKINQNIETEVGDFVDDLYSDVDGDSVHGGELTDGTNQNVEDETLGDKSGIGYQLGAEQQLGGVGVVYNPETGMFEVTGPDGVVNEFTFDEMNEFGIAIPEAEMAMYESSTGNFQMSDEELGLEDDPFAGLGGFELVGGEDLLNQSDILLDSSNAIGGGAASIAGGGSASALAGSGGTGTLGGVLTDSIGGDGVTGLGGVEQDLGYGLNPDGTAITHDQYMATAAGGNNINDLATNYGGGFNMDFGLGDFNFQDLPD